MGLDVHKPRREGGDFSPKFKIDREIDHDHVNWFRGPITIKSVYVRREGMGREIVTRDLASIYIISLQHNEQMEHTIK